MFELLLVVIGIFIGWNWEQPRWARRFQELVVQMMARLFEALWSRFGKGDGTEEKRKGRSEEDLGE